MRVINISLAKLISFGFKVIKMAKVITELMQWAIRGGQRHNTQSACNSPTRSIGKPRKPRLPSAAAISSEPRVYRLLYNVDVLVAFATDIL